MCIDFDPRQTLSQISTNTKMCIGAIGPNAFTYNSATKELRIRARISSQRNYIVITLNGKDLYDLKQILVRGGKEYVKFTANDVYCDELDARVFALGSTRHASDEWVAQHGLKRVA